MLDAIELQKKLKQRALERSLGKVNTDDSAFEVIKRRFRRGKYDTFVKFEWED